MPNGPGKIEYAECPVCKETEHILEQRLVKHTDGETIEIICTNPEHSRWIIAVYGTSRAEARRLWNSRPWSNGPKKTALPTRVWELGLAENKSEAKKRILLGGVVVNGVVETNPDTEVTGKDKVEKKRMKRKKE